MGRTIPALKKQRLAYLAALLRDTAESCTLSAALSDDEFRRQASAWLQSRTWFHDLEREVEELLSEETPHHRSTVATPLGTLIESPKESFR